MANRKDDEDSEKTIPFKPNFANVPKPIKNGTEQSAAHRPKDLYAEAEDEERTGGDHMGGHTSGVHRVKGRAAAPEVSQGAWRERAFTPRALMSREEISEALKATVEVAKGKVGSVAPVFELVRQDWIPVLRQAVEQGGGDGIDAWLNNLFKPGAAPPQTPLVGELMSAFNKMRSSMTTDTLIGEARTAIKAIDRALENPKKLSFKVMEKELEGKLEVHELLMVLFSDDEELKQRLAEVSRAMDTLRAQLKAIPGSKPDGLYSNFARLKAEARVLTAELARRKSP
ncbi:MAG: hypothetical protein QM723_36610 [Myxococcaceae bacterium]